MVAGESVTVSHYSSNAIKTEPLTLLTFLLEITEKSTQHFQAEHDLVGT